MAKKSIQRELTVIENKYNEMAEELEHVREIAEGHERMDKKDRLQIFVEMLQELQTSFSMDGIDDLMMVTTDKEHGNYTLVALDREKIKLVFEGGNK